MSEITKDSLPLFNLNLVLNETGLKPDVLRVWERRYDLPKPQRSTGGQRLYSRQDIETIKWLRARQAQGMSIRRATDLWKELVASGHDPLQGYSSTEEVPAVQPPHENVQVYVLRKKWLEACLAFNRCQADDILNEAFALYPVEHICVEILQAGLHEIGERWYRRTATVQQEHFISAQVMRRIEALINATPDPTRRQTIMVGCAPGELHTYPSLFLSLMLRRKGYKVIDLGADIPLEQMQQTIVAIQPDLVIMSAQQLNTAASILMAAPLFRGWGVTLAYGGRVFNRIPSIRTHIPAFFLGENLVDAPTLVERFGVGDQQPLPDVMISQAQQDLASKYQEYQPRIALAMFAESQRAGLSIDKIAEVTGYLSERLSAALAFGEPSLIEPDLLWLMTLMSNRGVPAASLTHFLQSYSLVVQKVMSPSGDLIVEWIESFLVKQSLLQRDPVNAVKEKLVHNGDPPVNKTPLRS